MAVTATQARFESGGWYTQYRNFPFFAERAAWLHSIQPTGKIAVAACGWGYLVDELRKLGREAYGFDAASYAALKWASIRPAEAGRVVTASALTRTQMTSFRTSTVGMAGANLIPLVVTEDMLPALTNAEVTTALTELRRIATKLVHVCTCAAPTQPGGLVNDPADLTSRSADFQWLTHQAWFNRINQGLAVAAQERVMNAEGGAVL